MARAGENRNGRLKRMLRALKRMKAKAAAKWEEMRRLREETAQIESAMEQMKVERDLLRISLDQHSNDILFISAALDNITDSNFN